MAQKQKGPLKIIRGTRFIYVVYVLKILYVTIL